MYWMLKKYNTNLRKSCETIGKEQDHSWSRDISECSGSFKDLTTQLILCISIGLNNGSCTSVVDDWFWLPSFVVWLIQGVTTYFKADNNSLFIYKTKPNLQMSVQKTVYLTSKLLLVSVFFFGFMIDSILVLLTINKTDTKCWVLLPIFIIIYFNL